MSSIIELGIAAFILIGSFFLTVGTLGLLRLPNVYNRMHATTKATTLGTSSIFLAAALHFRAGSGLTALVGILFLFLTAPTGAHLISRAAHRMGVEFTGEAEWPEEHERETPGSRKNTDPLSKFINRN
jgi:multicomponent Na+:H+ antiporter subunit G